MKPIDGEKFAGFLRRVKLDLCANADNVVKNVPTIKAIERFLGELLSGRFDLPESPELELSVARCGELNGELERLMEAIESLILAAEFYIPASTGGSSGARVAAAKTLRLAIEKAQEALTPAPEPVMSKSVQRRLAVQTEPEKCPECGFKYPCRCMEPKGLSFPDQDGNAVPLMPVRE